MVLVDYSGIAMASVFSQGNQALDESFIRHMILNSLRMYNSKYRKEYGGVVIACDGGSWRKKVFPQYKAARKTNREASDLDWDEIFRIMNTVKSELSEYFPYSVIQTQDAEADDIIATLAHNTQEFGNHEPVMIVSADKDFIQLHKYKNVKQFSPATKKLITEKDIKRYTFEHIVRGDSGDGVPNVLSGDNTFVNGDRQTPLMKAKIDLWYKTPESDLPRVMGENIYRNYLRNKAVISLDEIPKDIYDRVLHQVNETPLVGNSKIFNYLIEKRCTQLIRSAQEFFTHA